MERLYFKKKQEAGKVFKNTELFIGSEDDVFLLEIIEKDFLYHHHLTYLKNDTIHKYHWELNFRADFIQKLEEQWLLISSLNEFDDHNAYVCDSNGEASYKFHAGESVSDCYVDNQKKIWLTFGDSGIFGDSPISAYGIVCLDKLGNMIQTPLDKAMEKGLLPAIIDGGAINSMDDDSILVSYYARTQVICNFSTHKILQSFELDPAYYAIWIIKNGDYIIFGEDSNEIISVELTSFRKNKVQILDEQGKTLQCRQIKARGKIIWCLTDEGLYFCEIVA